MLCVFKSGNFFLFGNHSTLRILSEMAVLTLHGVPGYAYATLVMLSYVEEIQDVAYLDIAPVSGKFHILAVESFKGDVFRIFTIEWLGIGESLNGTSIPLRYKFVLQSKRKMLVTIESGQAAEKEVFAAAGIAENGNNQKMENVDNVWKVLELMHKTQVEGVPLALCQLQERLLAGVGLVFRLYGLGKKILLRKYESKLICNSITSINRDRIHVDDIQEPFHYCKYRQDKKQLYKFADNTVPRWLTAAHHVDFDTMAGSDEFGYIYFVRLPQDVSDEIEEDLTGGKIKWELGKLNGAPNKVEEIVQFHIGDVVTCLHKASLIPGGGEGITCRTVMRKEVNIITLLPFTSHDDVNIFSHLEMHMRQEYPPLCGSDHMAYRSSYSTVKNHGGCLVRMVLDRGLKVNRIVTMRVADGSIFTFSPGTTL